MRSDLGMYDRVIVQDVIKSIAQTQQIDANAKHQFKGKKRERQKEIYPQNVYILFSGYY